MSFEREFILLSFVYINKVEVRIGVSPFNSAVSIHSPVPTEGVFVPLLPVVNFCISINASSHPILNILKEVKVKISVIKYCSGLEFLSPYH